jgi:hypothetical protein
MEKSPIGINTEYLEFKRHKEEEKKFHKLLVVVVLAGLTSPQWLPVAEKAVGWGTEIAKIMLAGN